MNYRNYMERALNEETSVVDVIWGRKLKGTSKILSLLFKSTNNKPIYNRDVVEKQFKKFGFDDKIIDKIRETCREVSKQVMDKMVKKYNLEENEYAFIDENFLGWGLSGLLVNDKKLKEFYTETEKECKKQIGKLKLSRIYNSYLNQ